MVVSPESAYVRKALEHEVEASVLAISTCTDLVGCEEEPDPGDGDGSGSTEPEYYYEPTQTGLVFIDTKTDITRLIFSPEALVTSWTTITLGRAKNVYLLTQGSYNSKRSATDRFGDQCDL